MSSKPTHKKSSSKYQSEKNKSSDYRIFVYGSLILIGILFYMYCNLFNFLQDDSFITYRYIKNFTEGNGLVFNIGERVEGYTCFLWVMILSLVKLLGFNFISASQTFGIIFYLAALFVTYRITSLLFEGIKNSLAKLLISLSPVILTFSNGAVAYWTVSGMETAMFSFFVTLGIYFFIKEFNSQYSLFPYSSLIFLLASLTRPEGNLIFAIAVIHKLIFTFKNRNQNSSITKQIISKPLIIWFGIYIIPALIFFAWRYSYYGYFFPNTFYAKTGSSSEYFIAGLDYFWEFAKTYGLFGILPVIGLLSLLNKEKFYSLLFLVSTFVIFSLYIIYVGGDVLRPSRFFVPIIPLFSIIIVTGLFELIKILYKTKNLNIAAYIIIIASLLAGYYSYKLPLDSIKRYSQLENGLVDKMKLTAQWLKDKQIQSGRKLTVAASTIGAISYYSDVTLIDMLGLTDSEIAHNPKLIPEISENTEIGWRERHYNVEYIMSRKPDYIYFSTGVKPSAYAERGLFTSEEFMKYYYPYYFVLKEYQFSDCVYKRKSVDEANKTVLKTNPNYKKSYVNLYNQALNTMKDKSKNQEAMKLFSLSAQQGPSNFAAPFIFIGDLYQQSGNKDSALSNYKSAINIDDYSILAHYTLLNSYSTNNDTLNARLSYEKLKIIAPDILK